MAAARICIVTTVVLALITTFDFAESILYNYNYTYEGKAECPDRPIIASPDGGSYAPRIIKYMFFLCADEKTLPFRQRPCLQNYTSQRLKDTFTSVSLQVIEYIPKGCASNDYVTVVDGSILYNPRTVTTCDTQQQCLKAFNTDKNIVINPYTQFIDVVVNNLARIKSTMKLHQFLVESAQRTFSKYGGHFVRANNLAKTVGELNYVGVHVRRADVKLPEGVQPVKAEYFLRAMDYFRYELGGAGNTVFLIVTDDIKFAGNNLLLNNDTFLASHGGKNNPEFDMALLIHCNHLILDYGLFGMAAYLLGRQGTTVSTDADKQVMATFQNAPNWHFISINKDGSMAV